MQAPAMFPGIHPAIPATESPTATVLIDAEEDFDWNNPVAGTAYSTACMRNILQLREVLGAYGAVPTYLLTYPVLEDAEIVALVRRQLEKGHCEAGIQLHPWVTPPFAGAPTALASFSGNIGDDLEERKLVTLKQKFIHCFGFEPRIYRAGRYGLGIGTAQMLEAHGLEIDTSVAPDTSFAPEGGPDYTSYRYQPFWFGRSRRLLELPLCRGIVGWGGEPSRGLYRRTGSLPNSRLRSLLTRLRCAERITLSPEGNDPAAMRRLVRGLRKQGQSILPLSFHSSSLAAGLNPYTRTRAELHDFYDALSAGLDMLASGFGFGFAAASAIPAMLRPAPSLAA